MNAPSDLVLNALHLQKVVDYQQEKLTILEDASLDVKAGQSVAIVGASGSGKSTLLSILAGLDLASSGSVHLLGKSLRELDEDGRALLRRKQIGFVFQNFQLMPQFTTLENVMLPLELAYCEDAKSMALQKLERVGLSHRLQHYPRHLSGGEQQRVALARAFASEPKLLFADEPTGSLDSISGHKIIELMFEMNKEQGTALVLVTHDMHLAQRCDRCFELENGVLRERVL